jgi:hypothetical protein
LSDAGQGLGKPVERNDVVHFGRLCRPTFNSTRVIASTSPLETASS